MLRSGAALAIVAVAYLMWGGSVTKALTDEDYVCFPTCSITDGRMLSMAQTGVNSLAGQQIFFRVSAAPEAPDVIIGFFDGDTSGLWDTATSSPLQFDVYADPLGDTSGMVPGNLVASWLGATMPNNQWQDQPGILNTGLAQETPTSAHKYLLVISPLNPAAAGSSNLKVRTTGTLGLRALPFAFEVPLYTVDEAAIIYPGYPTDLVNTTYDGTWTFGFSVPNPGASYLTIWDGDLDWGPRSCTTRDTDDPDSPAFPSGFPLAPPTAAEGVAVGVSCTSGGGFASGTPADDSAGAVFRRVPLSGLAPNSLYSVVLPDGSVYSNLEPSGNLEWEQFHLDADPLTAFDRNVMDHKVPSLPGGVYEVRMDGIDAGNLNAYRFEYAALGVPPCCGPPAAEDAFYRIERYVWYDTDSDGTFDTDEAGIPGVTVLRTASNGAIQQALTDSTGMFTFRVPEGDYTLNVVASNFVGAGPLVGLRFTGNNGYGTHTGEVAAVPGMGPDLPYDRRDFGYVRNTPPTAFDDAGLCLCTGSATFSVLANDVDVDQGDTLTLTSITQPAHGTATMDGLTGTVTYTATVGYIGADSFTYTATDESGATTIGTVTLDVINNPPVLENDAAVTNPGSPVTVDVLLNDSDPDGGQTLVVASATNGTNGTTVVNLDGTITYTPNPGFSGTDTFSYTVSDACGEATAMVSITVSTPPPPDVCYVGTNNPKAAARQSWWINTDGTITVRTTLARTFNDNTYGATQVGWPGSNHKFNHLVTSDMVQVALYDSTGARKLEMKLDYFSQSAGFPSGYGTKGPFSKDGAMVFGPAASVVGADSSLAKNFNEFGYVLTANSPATDASYTPNPAYPDWIWDVYYDVTVSADVFGSAGFGRPRLITLHASPSKTGKDTEPITETSCVPVPPPPPPPPTGSGVCEGGVTKLVLKYIGSGSPSGVVSGQRSAPGKGPKLNAQVSGSSPVLYTFATTEMGGLFDAVSSGRLANNFTVFIGATKIADVHTSCSVPIYPGMTIGNLFEIVEVWSKGGGSIGLPPTS